MGRWLRKKRLQRRARLKDVSDAIGRSVSYVCDVEYGRRGHGMDPVIALLWCEYLALEPEVMFAYLGLGDTDLERFRIRHYLETAAWAVKFIQAKKALQAAEVLMDELLANMRPGVDKNKGYQIRDSIQGALTSLHVPQIEKKEAS